MSEIEKSKSNKQFTQTEKAKRGWWFSVVFMILVISLIMFLAFIPLQKDNRDIIVGMIGMITGAISSMLSIAAGRDPSEVEELKDKLSSANAVDGFVFKFFRQRETTNICLCSSVITSKNCYKMTF